MIFHINPINLLRALSMALELSHGIGLSKHHWRTAVISERLASHIGVDDQQRQVAVYAALLHDIGAASNWEERLQLVNPQAGHNLQAHAETGYRLLKDSAQLGMLAEPIRHHHDLWNGPGNDRVKGESIPLAARLIHLADRVEVLIRGDRNILEQRTAILRKIRQLSGIWFDPALVRVLEELSRQESFWLDLVNPSYYQNFFRNVDDYTWMRFTVDDIIDIAEIFATIIDATSSFTATHSRTVTEVCSILSRIRGFSEQEVKTMRIAGLLHDLGKLSVPNAILEKPGKLTAKEYVIVRQHPYYTYRILEQINGFETIAQWAAYHHETLDGRGYPFRLGAANLTLGSRIVAVADVFTALTENRPYRAPMSLAQAEKIMRTMVAEQKLDGNIVADLFHYGIEAYALVQATSLLYLKKDDDDILTKVGC